jgi:hypothetical protein
VIAALRAWSRGRYLRWWAVAGVVATALAAMLVFWTHPVFYAERVFAEASVAVTSWEAAAIAAGMVLAVMAAPRMRSWEHLGRPGLGALAGIGSAAVLAVTAILGPLAWAVINALPPVLIPFRDRALDPGARLADIPGAARLVPYTMANAVLVTSVALVAIALLGRFGGVAVALVVFAGLVFAQTQLSHYQFLLRAPTPQGLNPAHAVCCAVAAATAVVCWTATKGRLWGSTRPMWRT